MLLKCFTFTVISLFSSNDDRQVQCHFKNWIASVNWKTILRGSYFPAPALNVCIMKIKYKNMVFYKPFSLESVWMTLFHLPNSLHPPSFPSSLSNFSHDVSPLSSRVLFRPSSSTAPLPLLLFDLPWLLSLNSTHTLPYPQPRPDHFSFFHWQEVLPDRKRVTTRSYLPITPVDTDSGRNFTCVASNPAVPMGKRATVTLNIHRMLLLPLHFVWHKHLCFYT